MSMSYKKFKAAWQADPEILVSYWGQGKNEKIIANVREFESLDADLLEKHCWKGVEQGWLEKDWDTYMLAGRPLNLDFDPAA